MIDYSFVLHYAGLVGVLCVVVLAGLHQRFPFPVGPVDEVMRAGKRVPCLLGRFRTPVEPEVEHHPHVAYTLQISIARDASVMVEEGLLPIPLPVKHIIADSHPYALSVSFCVIEHEERMPRLLFRVAPHGVFVNDGVVPPAGVFVCGCEDRAWKALPFSWQGGVLFSKCHSCSQLPRLISFLIASKIAHPVFSTIPVQFVAATPGGIDERQIACLLATVPVIGRGRGESTPHCFPLQQISTSCHPSLVAFSIEDDVVHIPPFSFPENARTVGHLPLSGSCHHQPIFKRSLHFMEDGFHLLVRDLRLAL